LTNHGIEKIRSGFANDIYTDELLHLYEQQTDLRNLLKKDSEQLMKSLAEKISQNNNFDPELMNLVSKLHTQLAKSKGKKVYGYLKFDVKKTVDEIFARLADNESVKKMYDLWCEMEQQKHDVYSSAKVQFPKLVDNKEFRSVKNMIVQTVLNMDFPVHEIEVEKSDLSTKIDDTKADSDVKNSVRNENTEIEIKSLNYLEKQDIENEMLANTIFSMFVNLSRCIEDDYHHKFQSGRKMIDSKLRRMIQEKNQALGIKQKHGQTQDY